ncbi:unnamed protein product [Rotaria sp. Silwood2]|nr:unnamed protein product [Rotaria sp. Silwood2]CAF3104821.1 unnamed protein product [Rotaria sp. Silwood2]CAF3293669.1 unnamed protein product [Rotaria sp. Silwood2]CAF3329055.1 unnamed protein product [Rotaria sp. Silwood2]CAF4167096.1 unnamed protein product [Rotaria sp. Silwood2]
MISIVGGTRSGNSCQGSSCRTAGIIAGSVVGGIFALVAIFFLTLFCYGRFRRRSVDSNTDVVYTTTTDGPSRIYSTNAEDYFKDGDWQSRYHQYGRWHGPHQLSLMFDRATNKVAGHGYDGVGLFTIDGTFSVANQRMSLTKVYESGTGDRTENFGHTVILELTFNVRNGQFEGKWSVRTNHYCDEDKFELKLRDPLVTLVEKNVS